MTTTDRPAAAPRPGPRGRATAWVVATDATALQAATVTGAPGWRRPAATLPVRRSFATRMGAGVAVAQLRAAGYSAALAEPSDGVSAGHSAPRVRADVWEDAKAALKALDAPRTVTVTVEPGTSRSGAVTAFLRALAAAQVSAEGSS